MPSLWKLTDEYRRAMEAIGESETPEEDFLALEAIEASLENKIENVAKYIIGLNADAKALKEEEARLHERRAAIERKAESLKAYLKVSMEDAGRDKIKGDVVTVSLRKAPVSCQVVFTELIPEGFKETVTTEKIDRKALIQQFKADGEPIPGAEFVVGKRTVQIK